MVRVLSCHPSIDWRYWNWHTHDFFHRSRLYHSQFVSHWNPFAWIILLIFIWLGQRRKKCICQFKIWINNWPEPFDKMLKAKKRCHPSFEPFFRSLAKKIWWEIKYKLGKRYNMKAITPCSMQPWACCSKIMTLCSG